MIPSTRTARIPTPRGPGSYARAGTSLAFLAFSGLD